MSFCLNDGTPLIVPDSGLSEDKTVQMSETTLILKDSNSAPTEKMNFANTEETQLETQNLKRTPPTAEPNLEISNTQTKSKSGFLMATILGVLALLGIGIGGFIFLQNSKTNDIAEGNSKSSGNNSNDFNVNTSSVSVNVNANTALPSNTNLKPSPTVSTNQSNSNKPTPKPSEEKEEIPTPKPTATPTPATPTPTPVETPDPNDKQVVNRGVLNSRASNLVTPPYPPAARAMGASGEVRVHVLVDENGNVVMARAVSGHPLLKSSAEGAARSSKFYPALINGHPVKMNGVIVYNFSNR